MQYSARQGRWGVLIIMPGAGSTASRLVLCTFVGQLSRVYPLLMGPHVFFQMCDFQSFAFRGEAPHEEDRQQQSASVYVTLQASNELCSSFVMINDQCGSQFY